MINNIINLIVTIYKYRERKLLVSIIIFLTILSVWLSIRIEMWLYEKIIIDAMGASLNKLSFWKMVGLDLFIGMITAHSPSSTTKD